MCLRFLQVEDKREAVAAVHRPGLGNTAILYEALTGARPFEGETIEVLVQGQGSKRQLMQRFLDSPHAVLVGSQSVRPRVAQSAGVAHAQNRFR